MNTDSKWSNNKLEHATQVWLAVNHIPASHLANEFDVRSELHGQVSLAVVKQIFVSFMRL